MTGIAAAKRPSLRLGAQGRGAQVQARGADAACHRPGAADAAARGMAVRVDRRAGVLGVELLVRALPPRHARARHGVRRERRREAEAAAPARPGRSAHPRVVGEGALLPGLSALANLVVFAVYFASSAFSAQGATLAGAATMLACALVNVVTSAWMIPAGSSSRRGSGCSRASSSACRPDRGGFAWRSSRCATVPAVGLDGDPHIVHTGASERRAALGGHGARGALAAGCRLRRGTCGVRGGVRRPRRGGRRLAQGGGGAMTR